MATGRQVSNASKTNRDKAGESVRKRYPCPDDELESGVGAKGAGNGTVQTCQPPPHFPHAHSPGLPFSLHIQTMSNAWWQPWSNDTDSPLITRAEYIEEKATLAGIFIASILYGTPPTCLSTRTNFNRSVILGVVILLFFQCMAALLNPVHRRGEGIKWWLVSHTVAMFSFVTVYTAMNLHIQSKSFIDKRKDHQISPTIFISGPLEYQLNIRGVALGIIPNAMFNLNNWLADGLLVSSLFDTAPTRPGI